jgi:hypothetical protein
VIIKLKFEMNSEVDDITSDDGCIEDETISEELKKDSVIIHCENILREAKVPLSGHAKKAGRPPGAKNKKLNKKLLPSTQNHGEREVMNESTDVTMLLNARSTEGASGGGQAFGDISVASGLLLQTILAKLIEEITMMRKVVCDLGGKMETVLCKVANLEAENSDLRQEIRQKDRQIENFEMEMDDKEQELKRGEVILSGADIDTTVPDLQVRMANIISNKLRIEPESAAKMKFKKLGRGNTTVVAIVEDEQRRALFQAARGIRPDGLYVSESLTGRRRKLMFDLRNLKRAGKIYSVFPFYGKIYIKKSANADKEIVRTLQDVGDLIDRCNAETRNIRDRIKTSA